MVSMEKQTVNPKGRPSYYIENYLDLFFTANEFNALHVRNKGERRSFIAYHSGVPSLDSERAKKLAHWYDHGGKEAMLHYFLYEVDTDDFNPYAPAPLTSGKTMMAEASMTPAEEFVARLLADGAETPDKPLYSFSEMAARFSAGPELDRKADKLLSLALAKAESRAAGLKPTVEHGRKHTEICFIMDGQPKIIVAASSPSDWRASKNARAGRILRGLRTMSRSVAIVFALAIVAVAVFSGNGPMLLRAAERELAHGISREVSHSLIYGYTESDTKIQFRQQCRNGGAGPFKPQ